MAKQLNVDLRFTANNAQAKAQIQDLQNALNNLMTSASKNTTGLGITKDIAQATNEVAKLQAMLESSKNSSGGLDLGKFNQSLQQGQMKISDYAKTLSSLGPQGDQAFAKLAKSIINAEVPLKRTNNVLNSFKTSLANTARWQISSSILHGFMGAIQSAYGYAQDLNESLNNIRIVTGQNVDQMANFAKEANKAAQALSTTTTEYTNASLIYYQQGLSDSEVAKRTEVTIKMANAAGESAEKVSDQLTAIWNNFYDGSKSLEYYADVMTALGAATASSTDEIAGGLEKFAAIGETIGLSYEYAASALATITSNTRQSEEVVGTALKTIFARIQGLNLGETLDDGTTLNKYSEALNKIGISIFQQNGEIKKMDDILDEMANKWETLAKDQQIALAQTVAGVRQYTQLIALMDNWNAGDNDSMIANLNTTYNATGTLQDQADIYAESWEAARDRVTAAAEEIYNQLLNDEFFIELNNGFAGFLNIVSNTIDTLGGLPGVLSVASTIMFKMFGKDMAKAIDDWGYNIKLRSKEGLEEILKMRQESISALKNLYADNVDTGPVNSSSQTAFESQAQIADSLLIKRQELLAKGTALSEQDELQAQTLLKINEALGEQVIESSKALENTQKQSQLLESQAKTQIRRYNNQQTDPKNKIDVNAELKNIKEQQIAYSALESTFNKLSVAKKNFATGDEMVEELRAMSQAASDAGMDVSFFENILQKLSSGMTTDEVLNVIEQEMYQIGDAAYNDIEKVDGLRQKLLQVGMSSDQIDRLIASWEKQGIITAEVAEKLKNVKVQGEAAADAINKMQGPPPAVGQKFIAVANTISNIAMSINMVKGLIDTWNNEDMSFGEKLISTFTTLGMVIPMVTTALTGNNLVMLGSASASIATALGFDGVAISAKVAAGGVGALWAALWPIVAILAAVAAAAWLLVEAWDAMKKASPEGQLEAAKKEAKELKTALDDAKTAADELNSAFNSYDSAVEALENCTKGTQEWRDALQNVNNEVLNLLSKYPELSKFIDYGENGEMMINDEGRQLLTNRAQQRVNATQAASTAANQQVREAQIKVDTQDLATQINKQSGTYASKTIAGETYDYSAMVSNFIAQNAKQLSGMTQADQSKFITDYLDKNGIISNTQAWVDAITDLGPEFGKLINSIATKIENQAIASNALADNEVIQNSKYVNDIIATSGDIYGQLYEKEMAELDRWGKDYISQATGVNQAAKDVWNDYLEAAGLSATDNRLVDTTGTDNNREFVYKNAEGEEKSITLEAMKEIVASANAIKELGGSAQEVAAVFTQLSTSGNDADKALQGLIANEDMSSATKAESEALKKAIDEAGGIESYLGNKLGGDDNILSDEEAQAWGYDTAQAMIDALGAAVEGSDEEWASVGDQLIGSVKTAFEESMSSGMFDKLSLEQTNQMADLFKSVFENAGSEGVSELQTTLSAMFTASGEDADKLANILSSVDWQTTNVTELSQMLKDAGINTEGFADELAKLIDLMKEGQNVGFDAATEHYTTMQDMVGLKEGDTITEEQFKYLENAGIDASEYFKLMGDGSYALKEDAEEFYHIVNEKSLDVFKSNIEAMYQEIGLVDGIIRRRDEESITAQNLNDNGTYNKNLVSDQLTFLEALNVDLENLESYKQIVAEGGNMSVESLNEIQRLVEENKERWDELPASIQATAVELEKHQEALANSAISVDELNRLYEQQFITLEQYQDAVDEVMETEFEMEGLDPDAAEEVADAFRDMADAGVEGMEALKNDEEAVKDATVRYMELNEAIEDIYDNYDDYVDVLKDVRKANSQADKAMAANTDTAKKLKTSLARLIGTTEDMIDADFIAAIDPKDFEAAANGNADAIERIRNQFVQLKAEMYGIDFDSVKAELDAFNNGAYIDLDTTPFLNSLIQAAVNAGQTAAEIEAMLSGFGIDADVTPFTEDLWQATQQAQAAGQDIANATSFTTEVEQESIENPRTVENPKFDESVVVTHKYGWNQVTMDGGFGYISYPSIYAEAHKGVTTSIDTQEFTDTETVKGQTVTNGAGASGKGGVIVKNAHKAPAASKAPSSSNTSRPPVSSGGGGGGGGGSTPKTPDKVEKREPSKKSDTVERYREVTDAIDNVTDALTRAERATDRLWGKDKLDAMRQENKILAEQYKLLQQKAKEAEDYAKQDYNDLMDVADEIDVSVVVDTNTGDITNIEDVEKTLQDRLVAAEAEYNRKVDEYNAAIDAAGDSPTEAKVEELEVMKDALEAYEKDIIDGIEDDISAWKDAEQTFQDSVETWEEAGLDAEEILDQMMQKNFDIWSESLQLEVEVNDRDLELLDYYLSKIEDNVYQMAEAAALMVGNLKSGFEGGQLGEYLDNLSIYGEKYAELTDRLNSTDPEYQITSAQYKEGLEEIQSGLLDNLSSIQELDDAMLNYYGDTLSMVEEEIDKYTGKMEHQTSILEHYANMMDILGKSQDYKAMGTILDGQVQTIQNELDVAEAEYNLYAEEAEKKRKLYEEAVAKGDVAAAELYKGEWEAAEEAAMEAQSNMLDKTEQWAEAMKAVVENKLQGLAKSLEEALTGGTSFDQINTQLERAASLQEEYLTTTNQIYETNKLMRTAQQDMDKTTNSVAKQRLKDFIKETDQLQDKSKLSKYELEIQQAKYDLLLAEIALEDAQNAKSTVRLQRDSEGNMGYVYTADQSQLSQAQQELEDAQNSLYNIGLEGANDYAEKYSQTMQEMYDTLTSITEAYYNGEITSKEEYDRQMLEAQEYYYEQLENFQDLYGIALQTDTRVIKDAWSSSFSSMINNTSTWKDKVKIYSDEAAKTMADWYSKVDEISQKTGLDNIANKVKAVTDESKALRDAVLGTGEDKGVIEALKDELTAVSDLTGGYANLRATIQGLITDYENLMKTVNNAQNQQQEQENKNKNGTGGTSGDSDTNNGDTNTGSDTTTNDPTPGSPTTTTPTIAKGQSVTVKTTATHFSRDGGNGTRMRSFVPGGNYTVMNFDEDEVLIGKGGVATGWVKKTDLVGFATGGYTGEWGPYGKMAMLHEKELVLNQDDTANFLASMEILERILEVIDLQSLSAQLGGVLYTPSIGGNNATQTIEQSVHIEASFPGVSDRNEIEEAFNNIINTASQYANRRF